MYFVLLFLILILDPKCSCNGGTDLGAATTKSALSQNLGTMAFLHLVTSCFCNGGTDLGAATTQASCHKTSCSDASKQGTLGPHFWNAFINGNPCLNCRHRRFLLCGLILDSCSGSLFCIPDAVVMAVPTLAPPPQECLVTKPQNTCHFHGYIAYRAARDGFPGCW